MLTEQIRNKFIELDIKLGAAIGQNKTPMVSYYYGKMAVLFDLFGRTKINKNLCPAWKRWNLFTREMKKSELYSR